MKQNWRAALFTQAISDYNILILLSQSNNVEICHLIHYLQMASEKIAKGFMSDGVTPPNRVHWALNDFIKSIPGMDDLRKHFGFADDVKAFKTYLDEFKKTTQYMAAIPPGSKEKAVGVSIPLENPEYPWETPRQLRSDGTIEIKVHAPSDYRWEIWHTTEMVKFLEFLDKCMKFAKNEV